MMCLRLSEDICLRKTKAISFHRYEEAIKYFTVVPKYRLQAIELAKQEGLISGDKKKQRGKTKEEIKESEEKAIRYVIEKKMDIRGVYAKPTYR